MLLATVRIRRQNAEMGSLLHFNSLHLYKTIMILYCKGLNDLRSKRFRRLTSTSKSIGPTKTTTAADEMATLVTIPVSNFVEKARWALQLAGVTHTERKYAPVFAYVSTMPNGGKSVPLLVLPAPPLSDGIHATATKPTVLTDSSDILDYCATKLPSLYPTPETKALELKFDKELGPFARCIGTCVHHVHDHHDDCTHSLSCHASWL